MEYESRFGLLMQNKDIEESEYPAYYASKFNKEHTSLSPLIPIFDYASVFTDVIGENQIAFIEIHYKPDDENLNDNIMVYHLATLDFKENAVDEFNRIVSDKNYSVGQFFNAITDQAHEIEVDLNPDMITLH